MARKKVEAKGRGGVPCCGRGGAPVASKYWGGISLATAKPKTVFQPVPVEKKFFGGLTKALKKANESVMTGMVEDVVHSTAKGYGYKRGGKVAPSVF